MLLGYEESQLIGLSFLDLVHRDDSIAWHLPSAARCGGLQPALEVGAEGADAAQPSDGLCADAGASESFKQRLAALVAAGGGSSMTAGQHGSMTVPTTMDYRIRRKDGSYLWVETVLMAAGDSGYVCVTRDISQRKEAESNTKAMMHEIQARHETRVSTLLSAHTPSCFSSRPTRPPCASQKRHATTSAWVASTCALQPAPPKPAAHG